MATVNFLLLTCILVTTVAVAGALDHTPPPTDAPESAPPGVDCTVHVYNMADCMPFLSVGSNETEPTTECCNGFKSVLDADSECLCEALKSSVDLGLDLDLSRVPALSIVCGLKASPLSSCNISIPPSAAPPANPPPANNTPPPPAPAPETPPVAPAPGNSGGGQVQAPAPSPKKSKACASAYYSAALYFSMVVVGIVM